MTLYVVSPISSSFAPVLLEHYHTGVVYLLQRRALYARLLQLGERPACYSDAFPRTVNHVRASMAGEKSHSIVKGARRESGLSC
jgi:hypothetical protein